MRHLALTINNHTTFLPESEADDAMYRYWTAKSNGDTSANLVRIDRIPEVVPVTTTPPGEVSDLAAARIEEQEAWLNEAGFSLPPPIYAPGTRVIELGDDNFRLERQRVDALPDFPSSARRVISTIANEDRDDVTVPLRDLEMASDGSLRVGSEQFGLEMPAFSQLASLVGFSSGTRYLAEKCSPDLRAVNVNRQLGAARDRSIVLRTRLGGEGHRSAYAVVSPSYTAFDVDDLLEVVGPALADARTEMVYDGTGVSATALWMPNIVQDLAAGDVFKAGIRLTTADDGKQRVRIASVIFRNLCLNLLVIGEGEVEAASIVHRGNRQKMITAITAGVNQARASVSRFLEAWGHARTVRVDPEETIRSWVEQKKLKVPGVRSAAQRDATVEALLRGWEVEGGDSLAATINGVTRAAHENTAWDHAIQAEIERQAARLVYVPR